jgi:hypothetical protein
MNCAYWLLSGSIFGFIWSAFQFKSIKSTNKDALVCGNAWLTWALCAFVPFFGIYEMSKIYKSIKSTNPDAKLTGFKWHIIFGIILPLYPVNVVSVAMLQQDLNRA